MKKSYLLKVSISLCSLKLISIAMPNPMVCFTCGRPVNKLYKKFNTLIAERENNEPVQLRRNTTVPDNDDIFIEIGLGRNDVCCRKTLNTSVNLDYLIIPPYAGK